MQRTAHADRDTSASEERTSTVGHQQRTSSRRRTALLRAAHPGPALAVTVLAGLLAVTAGLAAPTTVLVVAAVLTGQLSIGWSNDLLDVHRDRLVHRTDKPLATGEVGIGAARAACLLALVATVPLSLACGAAAGLAHLVCVAAGLGLQPRAEGDRLVVAALRRRVRRACRCSCPSPAHPAPCRRCGCRSPGRCWASGRTWSTRCRTSTTTPRRACTGCRTGSVRAGPPRAATAVLVLASVLVSVAAPAAHRWATWLGLLGVAALAAVALGGRGRTPFRAAMAIALVDVVLLAGAR